MKSDSLPPIRDSDLKYFLRTQIWTKPKPPPPSTSLAGSTALITGSNGGIGLECARVLLGLNLSHIILGVRNVEKGEVAASSLRKAHPQAKVEAWTLDMASYESIQTFTQRCSNLSRLDIVILNAAIFNVDFVVNRSTGHEETFQVNCLSTTLLAILLLPMLKSKSPAHAPGRLTLVSSTLALRADFPNQSSVPLIPSLDDRKVFDGPRQYSLSKMLVLMLMVKISASVSANDVVVNAVGPAVTGGSSKLDRNASPFMRIVVGVLKVLAAHTPKQAAWLYVNGGVVRGKESHGCFIINGDIYPFHALMVTSEGQRTMDQLWKETLEELKFAGVEEILAGSQSPMERSS
ncbi:hypothetical protein B7463_g3369, partial [Scytalidium lignicola]